MSTSAAARTEPVAAVRAGRQRWPLRRPALWRELTVGLAVFGVYAGVTSLRADGRRAAAAAHAGDVLWFERWLHLDVEQRLNAWLAPHRVLATLANYEYAFGYVLSAFVLLFWVYARRPEAYRWARSSFIVLNLVGVTCFALYPLMPPRLLPDAGYVDTVLTGHTWGSWGSQLVAHANTLAAVPSLHVAWALWVSAVLASLGRVPRIFGGADRRPDDDRTALSSSPIALLSDSSSALPDRRLDHRPHPPRSTGHGLVWLV